MPSPIPNLKWKYCPSQVQWYSAHIIFDIERYLRRTLNYTFSFSRASESPQMYASVYIEKYTQVMQSKDCKNESIFFFFIRTYRIITVEALLALSHRAVEGRYIYLFHESDTWSIKYIWVDIFCVPHTRYTAFFSIYFILLGVGRRTRWSVKRDEFAANCLHNQTAASNKELYAQMYSSRAVSLVYTLIRT